ncbi:DUF6543 domain-containing protein [Xanthomonas sp. WHRI 1810A]|uniref:dermonecrotic toxin domain-containing protein n=1 Tax=Xanthomonas sp. WHRI 1810A TaxID=3161565 RepID=UPI0032E8A480
MTRDPFATLPFMETDVDMSNTAQHPTTCSPDLDHVASRLFHELVSADYPDVQIDTATALLVCQDRIERDTGVSREYGLISSLIDHFTGALAWRDYEQISIHPDPATEPDAFTKALLDHAQVVNLYEQFRNRFAVACKRDMQDYWDTAPPGETSRRSQFIAARVAALTLEANARLEQGDISSQEFTMLEAMLGFGADYTNTRAQRHGVYGLSVLVGENSPVTLSDAFVLISQRTTAVPDSHDEMLGSVVCYLPTSGLEAFGSLRKLTESLIQRLRDRSQRQQMLARCDLKALDQEALDAGTVTQPSALQCRYIMMERGFLGVQFSQMVARQQAEFDHSAWRAKALGLDDETFDALQTRSIKASAPVDNHAALRRNDARQVTRHMPDWWQGMDTTHRNHWLRHANTFARNIIDLKTLSDEHFKGDDFTSDAFLRRHIQETIDQALKEQAVRHKARDILVRANKSLPLTGFPALPTVIHIPAGTREVSLPEYCYLMLTGPDINYGVRTRMTDRAGADIVGLDETFFNQLVARLEDKKAWDNFLDHHLKTSEYAAQLKRLQSEIVHAQLRMGLLEVKQQRFSAKGLQWIQAVLDGPDPATRKTVDSKHIAVHCLEINKQKLPNVFVLAPEDDFAKGPMVLCTLAAPDNIVFRWYDSLFQLDFGFVENKHFQPYLAMQLAASRRAQAWGMLEYNALLRYWRMPKIVEYLPTPLPIADFIFHPVTYCVQEANLFDGCWEIRSAQLIDDIKARLAAARAAKDRSDAFDFVASIALWFLPPPITIPLALGASLCKAWDGFQKIDEGDLAGAARELQSALGYLAVAGIGALATSAEAGAAAVAPVRRAHLVRRLGRDGEQQIGYLMSPATAPYWPEPSAVAQWDADRFKAVQVDGETSAGYVERRLNMFGRSRLYRRAPSDENLLIHEDDYVVRGKDNLWKVVSTCLVKLGPAFKRRASAELTQLILGWPTSVALLTGAERSIMQSQYLALAKASNAELFGEVLSYVEGGSAEVNAWLRAGASNLKTRRLLNEFFQLRDWSGVAFRATHVSNVCWPMLQRDLGTVFVDRGLQSASMSRMNAQQWSQETFVSQHASATNKPVFFVFGPSIQKKNLFCEFLGDHVCVPPDTPLQLQAFKVQNDKLFVYFDAPSHAAGEIFDVYTGERYTRASLYQG